MKQLSLLALSLSLVGLAGCPSAVVPNDNGSVDASQDSNTTTDTPTTDNPTIDTPSTQDVSSDTPINGRSPW